MSEKDSEKTQYQQWEYTQLDTADEYVRQAGYKEHLKVLGKEGWEAYSVVTWERGGMMFFLKRPIIVERPSGAERFKQLAKL
ncbi:hypothetical protein [Sorangium sp. So ce124]|uniref:hypothetical protein n=1 Tax=Sorangium sp. So ce124 TaxID=3133280 RepID=UPI003F638FCB